MAGGLCCENDLSAIKIEPCFGGKGGGVYAVKIDMDALFKKEAFASLGAERLRLFRQFTKDIDGKSIPEIAILYAKLNQVIAKEKPLTQAERDAVIKAITESLPDTERPKFAQALRILTK